MTRKVVVLLLLFLNRFFSCRGSKRDKGAFETILRAEENRKEEEGQHGNLPLYGGNSKKLL